MWDVSTGSTARPLPALVSSGPSAELSLCLPLEGTINANQGHSCPLTARSVSVQQGGESWAGGKLSARSHQPSVTPQLGDCLLRQKVQSAPQSFGKQDQSG